VASSGISTQQGHQGSTPPWAVRLHHCVVCLRLPDSLLPPALGCTPAHLKGCGCNDSATTNVCTMCTNLQCEQAACYKSSLARTTRRACRESRALLAGLCGFTEGTARAALADGGSAGAAASGILAKCVGTALTVAPASAPTVPPSATALTAGMACAAENANLDAAGAAASAFADGVLCAGSCIAAGNATGGIALSARGADAAAAVNSPVVDGCFAADTATDACPQNAAGTLRSFACAASSMPVDTKPRGSVQQSFELVRLASRHEERQYT
jgi:hypothetical protein